MTRTTLRNRAAAFLVVVAATIAGCSSTEPTAGEPVPSEVPEFGHVHALAVDPGTGAVYAATHTGVWSLPDPYGETSSATLPAPIGDGRQDTMGMTVTADGVLYASGHPGPGEAPELSPPVLGLIRSDDGARTWETVSLRGEVDFHALDTTPLDDGLRIVGVDSGTATLLVSDDAGATWTTGAAIAAHDVEILPDHDQILATTADGLQLSTDGGRTFTVVAAAPPLLVIEVSPDGTVLGVDTTGRVWMGTADLDQWDEHGAVPGNSLRAMTSVPAADPGGEPSLLVADDTAVVISSDLGTTWERVAELG
jgi:hypothetical protein